MVSDRDRIERRLALRRQIRRRRAIALGAVGAAAAGGLALAVRGGDAPRAIEVAKSSAAPAVLTTAGTGTAPTPSPTRPRGAAPGGTVRIAAVGDIVMGSRPYGLPPDGGRSFFSDVDGLIAGDVVLGNLEGTLATGGSSKCGGGGSPNCFAFRTPPSYSTWLKRAGFTVMNLANNHAYDFGAQGQKETLTALRRVKLKHTGRPGEVATQTVRGIRVALVGFAAYKWANPLTDIPQARRLVAAAAKKADIVVVTMHAGAEGSDKTHVRPGMETYLGEPRGDSVRFSRAVIDAGADLVVGHGPHVMRGMEFYKGRLIAYSMGNFAGYKVFSLGGTLSTSGVLQVALRSDGRFVKGRLRPTQIVKPGYPRRGGSAVSLVSKLSRQDFRARGARVARNGTIRPPAGSR